MINGEPSEPFPATKGLRQGDPMSPFLFAISMEYLSRTLSQLKKNDNYHHHPRCAKLGITHLCFADDLLIFSRGDPTSVSAVHIAFKKFTQASGLQANLGKSLVYFGGVNQQQQVKIIQLLGYSRGELPFKYLGVPLSTKKMFIVQWSLLIDKVVARISSWESKHLSYVRRLQLIQTMMTGIKIYWVQLFNIPAKVLQVIESYCRSYLLSGGNVITKRVLVAWDKVCVSKTVRGLNILSIAKWNKAAITKLCWDLAAKKDTLWIKWVHTYYIRGGDFHQAAIPKQAAWLIRKIFDTRETLLATQRGIDPKGKITRQIYHQLLAQEESKSWKG